jgi:hypothetical protein
MISDAREKTIKNNYDKTNTHLDFGAHALMLIVVHFQVSLQLNWNVRSIGNSLYNSSIDLPKYMTNSAP